MDLFLALIGFIGFIVFIILAVVGAIKKNGKAKKSLAFAGASVVVFIIAAIIGINTTPTTQTSEENTEETEEVADTENVESVTTNEKTEEELAAEKEAEAKAAEEAKKKEAEEAAKLEQQKYANLATIMVPSLHEGLTLQDATYDFITSNYKLFPAFNQEDIEKAKSITDSSISSKHLNKNATPYLAKMTTFAGTVISVEESTEGEDTLSLLHILDDDFQSYQILMYKTTGDILEDDTVRFWGVPVGPASFDNISGGTTNVQFFIGSHAEKQ